MVHFILYVANQETATNFYEKLFRQTPRLHVPGMTEFDLDQACILGLMPEAGISKILSEKTPPPSSGSGIPRAELYLHVDDPSTWFNRAIEFGATAISESALRDWGHQVAYCMDPDGHILAFAIDENSAYHTKAIEYDQWFEEHTNLYESELLAIERLMPATGCGLEIGVGSARFASRLQIRFGIDPSPAMASIAQSRGINTEIGRAEALPYQQETFDFVLLVTSICFIQDPQQALKEMKRVLKPNGIVLLAFINKESELGKSYEAQKQDNPYYRDAHFYSTDDLITMFSSMGFTLTDSIQTLFSNNESIIQQPEPGNDRGSFVVLKFHNTLSIDQ